MRIEPAALASGERIIVLSGTVDLKRRRRQETLPKPVPSSLQAPACSLPVACSCMSNIVKVAASSALVSQASCLLLGYAGLRLECDNSCYLQAQGPTHRRLGGQGAVVFGSFVYSSASEVAIKFFFDQKAFRNESETAQIPVRLLRCQQCSGMCCLV